MIQKLLFKYQMNGASQDEMEITCPFHSLVYGIECHEQTEQVDRLVHPILKRGHSNSVEASHNILLRFRSMDIHLDNLHYELSSNLADL